MQSLFLALSGLMFLAAFVPYIRAILARETRPAKASWIVWVSIDWITLAAMRAEGSVNGIILGACFGGTMVVALSLIYGEAGWKRLDVICLGLAAMGILLWQYYDDATLCILVSQAVIVIGSVPTLASAAKNPEHENRVAWTMYWVGCLLGILAIPEWTLAHALQPITFFAVESVILYLLFRPRTSVRIV